MRGAVRRGAAGRGAPSTTRLWPPFGPHLAARARPHAPTVCRASSAGRSLYEVLGVPVTASAAEIKAAYRAQSKLLHPDVNKAPQAHEDFVACAHAYRTLCDQRQRAQYDAELRRRSSGSSSSGSSSGSSSSGSSSGASSQAARGRAQGSSSYGWGARVTVEWGTSSFDDDDDDYDEFFDADCVAWASKGSNYSSSFTSSWQGANGRKKRAAAAARAARAAAADGTAAGKARGGARGARPSPAFKSAFKSSKKGAARDARHVPFIDGDASSVDEVLRALGPEARATAQATFGLRLERLGSAAELLEFLAVLEVLQEDMGVEFDLPSPSSRRPSPSPSPSSRRAPRKAPPPRARAPSKAAGQQGRASSSGSSSSSSSSGGRSRSASAGGGSGSNSSSRSSSGSGASTSGRGAPQPHARARHTASAHHGRPSTRSRGGSSISSSKRAAAAALREQACGPEVFLQSPNRDWECICADLEGLIVRDRDAPHLLCAIDWDDPVDRGLLEDAAYLFALGPDGDEDEEDEDVVVEGFDSDDDFFAGLEGSEGDSEGSGGDEWDDDEDDEDGGVFLYNFDVGRGGGASMWRRR